MPRRSHTERTEHNKQSRTNANVNTTKEASKHEQREEASKHRLQEEAAKKREEEAAARRAQEEAADKRQEEVKARKTQEEATKSREQARKRQETKEAEEKKTASAPSPAAISAGKRLFDATCTSCHGMHGEGSTLAPAYGAELPRSESITGVIEQLTRPLNQKGCKCMPTYDAQYSSTEKEELADYVTTELTHTVKK